jgi:hypothetical protein
VAEINWNFLNSEGHPCQISSKSSVSLGADTRSDGHIGVTFGEIRENSLNVIRFS